MRPNDLTRTRSIPIAIAATVLFALGCDPGFSETSTVNGRVTDDGGSQALSFGGEGTVSSASTVQLSRISADGSLEVLAEADVAADGSYALEAPAGIETCVVRALDANGDVVASAILEATAEAGDSVSCTPMTSESSLEVEVLLAMVARGRSVQDSNPVDLRTRIDERMAADVKMRAEADGEAAAEVDVHALADAVIAAQQAEVHAYAEAGVTTSQAALFDAELAASQTLSSSLHAAEESQGDAYVAFHAALDQVVAKLGADEAARGQAESAAGASFRASVHASLSAEGHDSLVDASSRHAAALEARTTGIAIAALLEGAGATDATLDAAADAMAALRSELVIASSAEACAAAWSTYQANIVGNVSAEGGTSGSVLAAFLEADVATEASVQTAVDAAIGAGVTLDAAIDTSAEAATLASGSVDGTAMAEGVAAAYEGFRSTVQAQGSALSTLVPEGAVAIELLIVTEGSFAAGG